uniref:Uncharacterized protein n=1 Tax=Anthoceros punctatus TaxID=3234 RepID=A0A6M8B179_ANTPU|nr:hypothetical protein [Anthoceros punctatus]QKD76606.1 hypothetical protein [Anthoceros punctatus]
MSRRLLLALRFFPGLRFGRRMNPGAKPAKRPSIAVGGGKDLRAVTAPRAERMKVAWQFVLLSRLLHGLRCLSLFSPKSKGHRWLLLPLPLIKVRRFLFSSSFFL